jgi:hypothetical protein
MRQLLLGAGLVFAACSPDDLAGFQPPPSVSETAHTVSTVFEEGAARLRVRRTLHNGGSDYASVARAFAMPDSAVVTSLRLGSNGQWFAPGRLSLSEEVDAQWNLLLGPGTAEPVPLGKLEWSSDQALSFELFGLAPGATVDVEYEVELPSSYAAGEVSFTYPLEEVEPGWLPPQLLGGEVQQVEDALDVRRAWATKDAVDVRWATFPVDADRTLWRLEVDVTAELGQLPKQANVVFVVDGSISEGEEGIASQLELVAPYLASIPDARVEVVVYRRFAQRLFGRFVPAPDFARELALVPRERLAPANGSHVDVGVELAARVLAQEGAAPARMVVLTDERVRGAFANEPTIAALQQLAPRDTVVHFVARNASWASDLDEKRDDAAPMAPIAASTGGIFLRVEGHPSDPVLAADTLRHLVRPVRVDSFEVIAPGVAPREDEDEEDDAPDVFRGFEVDAIQREGSEVRTSGLSAQPPTQVTVRGKVWAKSFERVVNVDDTLARRLPAYAVGDSNLRVDLSEDELRTVAFVAGAVSPVTSYLAAPKSAAPSVIGVERLAPLVGAGYGSWGCGGCGSSSSCGMGFYHPGVDLHAALRALLQPGVAACEAQFGDASGARLSVEATADEVVDVHVTGVEGALASCLVEAAWAVRLSDVFERDTSYEITLR